MGAPPMPLLGVTPVASRLAKPVYVTAPPGDTARVFIVDGRPRAAGVCRARRGIGGPARPDGWAHR
jgi:hypothetical protein